MKTAVNGQRQSLTFHSLALLITFLLALFVPLGVFAMPGWADDLQQQINGAQEKVTLTEDITLNKTLMITKSITLDGAGHTLSLEEDALGSVISCDAVSNTESAASVQPESIAPIEVTIKNLTITGGNANDCGGGIYNGDNCNLTVENCRFEGNSAGGAAGGGIGSLGSATISCCTFIDNLKVV